MESIRTSNINAPVCASSVESPPPKETWNWEFGQEAGLCDGQALLTITAPVFIGAGRAHALAVAVTTSDAKIALVIIDLHAMPGRLSNALVQLQAHPIIAREARFQK